jgi:hypothetical protein
MEKIINTQAELLDQVNIELDYVKDEELNSSALDIIQYWEGRKVSLVWVKSLLESKQGVK